MIMMMVMIIMIIIGNISIMVLIVNKTVNIVLLKMLCGPPYFLITKITRLRFEFEAPGLEFHKVFVTNSLHSPLREHHYHKKGCCYFLCT
jgi:hypothetical protein